jgi:hypothetical protein
MLACPAPLPQQCSRPYRDLMQARIRKLNGTVVLLVFLAAYAWAAVIIGAGRITLAPHWAQLLYFAVAGLLWVLPAGLLIRWMQHSDAVPEKRR